MISMESDGNMGIGMGDWERMGKWCYTGAKDGKRIYRG